MTDRTIVSSSHSTTELPLLFSCINVRHVNVEIGLKRNESLGFFEEKVYYIIHVFGFMSAGVMEHEGNQWVNNV